MKRNDTTKSITILSFICTRTLKTVQVPSPEPKLENVALNFDLGWPNFHSNTGVLRKQ